MFPHIDLATQKVGIFGKIAKLDTALRLGDRVEIYRPITCDPQTILVEHALPDAGLAPFQIRNIFFHLGLPKDLTKPFFTLLANLFECCLRHRLLLAEINPLVVTADGYEVLTVSAGSPPPALIGTTARAA